MAVKLVTSREISKILSRVQGACQLLVHNLGWAANYIELTGVSFWAWITVILCNKNVFPPRFCGWALGLLRTVQSPSWTRQPRGLERVWSYEWCAGWAILDASTVKAGTSGKDRARRLGIFLLPPSVERDSPYIMIVFWSFWRVTRDFSLVSHCTSYVGLFEFAGCQWVMPNCSPFDSQSDGTVLSANTPKHVMSVNRYVQALR